jgi:hypothetical protein
MTWFTRLTLGLLSLLVLARAASAQTPQYQIYFVQDDGTVTPAEIYQPSAAPQAPAAQGYGYSQTSGYAGGYVAPAPAAQGYSYAQDYSGGYGGRSPCCTGGYTPPPPPPPPPPPSYGCCTPAPPPVYSSGCCAPRPPCQPHPPHPPHGCPPPNWGEVTLNDSFFWGGGGVGPEYIAGGGGGGGYAYAGAGASSYAYASASASARVTVGGRGGYRPPYKPPHRPHKPGGKKKGCGGCH